jgi:hypothetical protein
LDTTSGLSDLMFALDEDDEMNYPRLDDVLYEVNPRIRMCPTLNLVATKYAERYDALAFMGDDHKFNTVGWEEIFLKAIDENNGVGICYGNDLLQGQRLPTAVTLSSNIVRTLGYMVPPTLIHMYADNFWKELGERLKRLFYFGNIVIEHVHYSNNKSGADAQYHEVEGFFSDDERAYNHYKSHQMGEDISKLKTTLNL